MGQVRFENFDFLVKVKGLIGQSIFSLSFFFFSLFGPGQICGSVRVGSGQIGSIEDDVIHDVTTLRARVARAARMGVRHVWHM